MARIHLPTSAVLVCGLFGCTAGTGLDGFGFGQDSSPLEPAPIDVDEDTDAAPVVSAGDPSEGDPIPDDDNDGDVDVDDDDGVSDDSAEDDSSETTDAECEPGDLRSCYEGPAGTEGIGICEPGVQTCAATGVWGGCEGAVLPEAEACNAQDDDCNGIIDDDCPVATACAPDSPASACGAGHHCAPSVTGATTCVAPVGAGSAYSECAATSDCAPGLACITTPFATRRCLRWCSSSWTCGLFESCTFLEPALFAADEEYGACYDGWP